MTSHCRNGTRVWYANSTRTSIGFHDGTGLRVVSPRSSVGQVDQEWYYKAFQSDKKLQSSDHAVKLGGEANSLTDYLNKPLPATPTSPRLYSSIISADTVVNSYNGWSPPWHDPIVRDQTAPYDEGSPMELDTSTATEFAFAMAGIDLDTNTLVDNEFAALGTPDPVERLITHKTEEAEKQRVTEHFYTGVKPEETAGLFYAPLIDEISGYSSHREGTDDFHDTWQPSKTKPFNARQQVKAVKAPKTVLKPKSRKAKHDIHMVDYDSTDRLSRTTFAPPTEHVVYTDTLIKGNKRTAPDSSFANTTQYLVEDEEDDFLNVLPSKRLRVTEHVPDQEIPHVNGLRAFSVHSDDSDYSDCDDHSKSAKSAHAFGIPSVKRTSPTLTSFPGQFPSFEVPYLRRKKERNLCGHNVPTFPFGNILHPNNIYTHTNFIADPDADTLDYTQQMLDRLPTRTIAWEHATTMSSRAAKVLTRTPSEEHLRREAHLECAGARLEGVTVGEYRYYQGHMSVEEYVAANMCVCWGACYCSKLCTRFGDVLCPCSNDILLPED